MKNPLSVSELVGGLSIDRAVKCPCLEVTTLCLTKYAPWLEFLASLEGKSEPGSGISLGDNKKRFAAYKKAASLLNYRAREPLPDCVVNQVRSLFPEGPKTGYKD